MRLIERYRGYEVCRTGAGDLVVLDPRDSRRKRLLLVQLLAATDSLDTLFFASRREARAAINGFVAAGLVPR